MIKEESTKTDIFIGIDKTTIKSFTIEYIDFEKLTRNDNVILQQKPYGIGIKDIKGNVVNIDYLKITDGHIFNKLSVGTKINTKTGIPNYYHKIDVHISELIDNNLKPLKISEYRKRLEQLKWYLNSRYGILIMFNNAKFGELEINITARMDRKFIEYEYLITQMLYLIPKTYEKQIYIGKDNVVKQYEYFNKTTTKAKIYDKTNQIQEKFKVKIDRQYMRIEYTLKDYKKIRTSLGTEYVYGISDEAIKIYLKKQINKDLIKPIEKHIKESNKLLLQMAKELKEQDSRKWARMFVDKAGGNVKDKRIGKLNNVIDVEQIKTAIKKVSNPKNYSRTMNRLKVVLDEYSFLNDNLVKLQEIKGKFI